MDFTNIDPNTGAAMIELASTLSSLVLSGTATAIHSKIEGLKTERDANKLRNTYNEIINQLLQEREEAVRIAQTYKQELEKVVISDEDIVYLQQTISKFLDMMVALNFFQSTGDDPEKNQKNIEVIKSFKELISKDVLKTMQLLGFNYKAAIGEPLTQICAKAISSLGESKNQRNKTNKR